MMKNKSTLKQKKTYPRPVLVVSECLLGANVRYNAETLAIPWLKDFSAYIKIIKVCPEMEIGLGTPRPPIWSISSPSGPRLIQPFTGKDITTKMSHFSKTFLADHTDVDGFLLKSRSPSCGIDRVKLYAGADRAPVVGYTIGQFARKVIETHPEIVVSDERHMAKRINREQFLTTLFVTAAFREMVSSKNKQPLNSFHQRYNLLLKSLNVNREKKMSKLSKDNSSASRRQRSYSEYKVHLYELLKRKHRVPARAIVLNQILELHMSDFTAEKKRNLRSLLKRYENRKILFTDFATVLYETLEGHGLLTNPASAILNPFPNELLSD